MSGSRSCGVTFSGALLLVLISSKSLVQDISGSIESVSSNPSAKEAKPIASSQYTHSANVILVELVDNKDAGSDYKFRELLNILTEVHPGRYFILRISEEIQELEIYVSAQCNVSAENKFYAASFLGKNIMTTGTSLSLKADGQASR